MAAPKLPPHIRGDFEIYHRRPGQASAYPGGDTFEAAAAAQVPVLDALDPWFGFENSQIQGQAAYCKYLGNGSTPELANLCAGFDLGIPGRRLPLTPMHLRVFNPTKRVNDWPSPNGAFFASFSIDSETAEAGNSAHWLILGERVGKLAKNAEAYFEKQLADKPGTKWTEFKAKDGKISQDDKAAWENLEAAFARYSTMLRTATILAQLDEVANAPTAIDLTDETYSAIGSATRTLATCKDGKVYSSMSGTEIPGSERACKKSESALKSALQKNPALQERMAALQIYPGVESKTNFTDYVRAILATLGIASAADEDNTLSAGPSQTDLAQLQNRLRSFRQSQEWPAYQRDLRNYLYAFSFNKNFIDTIVDEPIIIANYYQVIDGLQSNLDKINELILQDTLTGEKKTQLEEAFKNLETQALQFVMLHTVFTSLSEQFAAEKARHHAIILKGPGLDSTGIPYPIDEALSLRWQLNDDALSWHAGLLFADPSTQEPGSTADRLTQRTNNDAADVVYMDVGMAGTLPQFSSPLDRLDFVVNLKANVWQSERATAERLALGGRTTYWRSFAGLKRANQFGVDGRLYLMTSPEDWFADTRANAPGPELGGQLGILGKVQIDDNLVLESAGGLALVAALGDNYQTEETHERVFIQDGQGVTEESRTIVQPYDRPAGPALYFDNELTYTFGPLFENNLLHPNAGLFLLGIYAPEGQSELQLGVNAGLNY